MGIIAYQANGIWAVVRIAFRPTPEYKNKKKIDEEDGMSPEKQCDSQPSTQCPDPLTTQSTISSGIGVPVTANSPVSGGESIRSILVVDDDPQMATLVAKLGTRIGFCCNNASDALDALFYLNQAHYDVVITDFDMPFMDGFQLADQIKKKYLRTRVILMTGQCEAVIKERMVGHISVDGLLFKPFNLNTMRDSIEAVCGSRCNSVSP